MPIKLGSKYRVYIKVLFIIYTQSYIKDPEEFYKYLCLFIIIYLDPKD
jgi:hypothetical protein